MALLDTKAGRLWRIFGTGLVFVLFGLGALLVSLTVFPILRITSANARTARPRIQHAMQLTFRLYVELMRWLGLLTYDIDGLDRLNVPGRLVVANHPTLIDVVFLVSFMPQVDCIVKQGLWRNPFLRWPVLWAAYIPNSSGEALIEDCARTLRRGNSLLVFPEGTRSMPGQPLRMQRGAAHIALAAEADILPVKIFCTEPMLTKGYPWHRAPQRRPHFRIVVGAPVPPCAYTKEAEVGAVAARRLTRFFQDYFADTMTDVPACGINEPHARAAV
jgi:1-acyl-sn-glycerol-3-phosphate acyltransferase